MVMVCGLLPGRAFAGCLPGMGIAAAETGPATIKTGDDLKAAAFALDCPSYGGNRDRSAKL